MDGCLDKNIRFQFREIINEGMLRKNTEQLRII